jgi:hypothetical protein
VAPRTRIAPVTFSSVLNGNPVSFKILSALIFWLEILLCGHELEGFPGPDRYFAYQWSMSYDHGVSRRAFLGEVLKLLHIDNGNYLIITALSWTITALIFWFLAKALTRVLAPLDGLTGSVLFAAILLSPLTTGILVATTGDPIQVPFLGFLVLSHLCIERSGNRTLTALAFVLLGVLAVLVHEASIFFIGPVLVLEVFYLRPAGRVREAFAGFLAGALPTLLLIAHATAHHSITAVAPMHLGATQMVANTHIEFGTFASLLAEENAAHFHAGALGYVLTFRNAVGALILPVLFALILQRAMPATATDFRRHRYVIAVLLPVLLSIPLWLIGHDWGRFTSYLFMLSIVALASDPKPATSTPRPALPYSLLGLLLFLAGVTSTRELPHYIVKGLGDDSFTMLAAVTLCAVGVFLIYRRHEDPDFEVQT